MASKGTNQATGGSSELLDIDIKTEALDYDEDFDREWNEEFIDTNVANPILTHGFNKQSTLSNGHSPQIINGFSSLNSMEEESESHSNYSGVISPSRIKVEPLDIVDDDYDAAKGRFNLRKRKASLTQESVTPPPSKEVEAEIPDEDANSKKRRKKAQYNYTNGMLQEALDLVHSQNISIMNAAKQYGIPRSTLRRYALTCWAATTTPAVAPSSTPKSKNRQEPALTPPEEAHLVSMITKMSRAGKYVSTMDVKSTVQHLLDQSQRVVFKDRNRPNAGWVQRFRKRHRNLQIKGSGYTVRRQTPLTKQDVIEWYNEIVRYLASDWEILDPSDIFSEANRQRVFNLDEMTLPLNIKTDLLEENLPKSDDDYTEITILTAVNAAGECLQPLIIQKGEGGGHEDDIMPLDQTSYGISFSLSGKMNSDIFLRWLEAFDRELCEKDVQKPIVVFLDDVFAHFHISVFSYAIDNDIILLCLQSQAGLILQPVEADITENVRKAYRQFCKEHYRTEMSSVSIDQFPLIFLRAWEAVRDNEDIKQQVIGSFVSMGLLPLNPEAEVYANFPLCSELVSKDMVKLEKGYKNKEPKAKKSLSTTKSFSKDSSPSRQSPSPSSAAGGLIPKVKIKKLDKNMASDNYKIVDGFPGATSRNTSPSYAETDRIPKTEDLSWTKWGTAAKMKKKGILPNNQQSSGAQPQNTLSLERLEGRQDGIKKCIDLMESFIPSDLIPVWRNRSDDLKNSCEIPYCMWKTVHVIFNDLNLQIQKQTKAASKTNKLASKGVSLAGGFTRQFSKKTSKIEGKVFISDSLQM